MKMPCRVDVRPHCKRMAFCVHAVFADTQKNTSSTHSTTAHSLVLKSEPIKKSTKTENINKK